MRPAASSDRRPRDQRLSLAAPCRQTKPLVTRPAAKSGRITRPSLAVLGRKPPSSLSLWPYPPPPFSVAVTPSGGVFRRSGSSGGG
ncbi:hypothetical protein SLA2020_265050 [Shorea laevis]